MDGASITTEDEGQLTVHLNNITEQFERVRKRVTNTSLESVVEPDTDSTRVLVHNILRQWTTKYATKCHVIGIKVRWAIHEKKDLQSLVVNIRDYMNDLMEVFPAEDAQRRLQEEDIRGLKPDEMNMLKHLAKDYDDMFAAAIEQAIKNRSPSSHLYAGEYNINGADEHFKHNIGDDVARGVIGTGHAYMGKFSFGGSGESNIGNRYR